MKQLRCWSFIHISSTPWPLLLAVVLLRWFSTHDKYTHFSGCPKILIISFSNFSSYFEFFRTLILIFQHYQSFKKLFFFTLFSMPSSYLNSVPDLALLYFTWNVQAESTRYSPGHHKRQEGEMLVNCAAFGSWRVSQRMDALSLKAPTLSLLCDVREDKKIHGSKNPKLKDLNSNRSFMNFPEVFGAWVFTDKKDSNNITKFLHFLYNAIMFDQLLPKAFLEMVESDISLFTNPITIIDYLALWVNRQIKANSAVLLWLQ